GPPRLVPSHRVLVEDGRRVREAAPEEQEGPDRRARRRERDVEPRGLDRHWLPHPRVERRASREEKHEENQGDRQEPGRGEREPLDGRRPPRPPRRCSYTSSRPCAPSGAPRWSGPAAE